MVGQINIKKIYTIRETAKVNKEFGSDDMWATVAVVVIPITMQQVYSVKPYVNFYENILPPDVMYSVKNYHDVSPVRSSPMDVASYAYRAAEESLDGIISRRQLELIEEISAFISCLNKALASCTSSSARTQTTSSELETVHDILKPEFTFRKSKVDTSLKEGLGEYPVELTTFKIVEYPVDTIKLFVGNSDECWLKHLAKIGDKASILFEGLNDGIVAPRCTVKMEKSRNRTCLVAEVNGAKMLKYVAVWKLLGELMSLYPTIPDHPDICTHIDYWLLLADDVLSNRSSNDDLCRRMSTSLSRHDYLVPNVAATFADGRNISVMSFKLGTVPLRRTYLYLQQGTIQFRDCVKIFAIGYKQFPRDDRRHKGVIEFVFWHWAQLQYNNPYVQLVRLTNISVVPFAKAFLSDGREVLFDLENRKREEIEEIFRTTLGKTEVSLRRERLEKMLRTDQALFGRKCKRECICELMDTYTRSTARLTDFQNSVPERILWRSKAIRPTEGNFLAGRYEIFFRETVPPQEVIYKGTILLIHGQSFSSSTWLENSTMQIFSAAGYRCLAFDMPGCGKTGGPTVPDNEKAEIIPLAMHALELDSVIVIGHSMAGQYIVPLLGTDRIACLVAVALSNTNAMPATPESIRTSVLVVWGEKDTSLGPSAASNLGRLPNSRLLRIPSAGHACYLSNAVAFQSACLNFFETMELVVVSSL
uniref:Ribosomal protein/NADH dehydrogenase domain-containing protein n=1 Tax=Setaria digitata TaxID=48799 RepID=A0A915Q1V3_9BILA